jgi:hypothetical protein
VGRPCCRRSVITIWRSGLPIRTTVAAVLDSAANRGFPRLWIKR